METTEPTTPPAGKTFPPDKTAALYEEIGKLVVQAGGLSGFVQQFEQSGLGGLVSGWIGSGANPPLAEAQVPQALGENNVLAVASKLGLSREQVMAGAAQLLPQIINRLTPQGSLPTHGPGELENALDLLKGHFFGS